jgi:ABC-type transporter Mla MlaB component
MSDIGPARVVTLSGDLTIRHAAEVQGFLADRLKKYDNIELDCTAITETDLSFLQLLVAASKSAAAAGKRIHLDRQRAGCVGDLVERAGLAVTFGFPTPGQTQGNPA